MTTPRGLIRGMNGELVPFGQTRRTLEANFLDGTVPSWLTTTAGTPTVLTPAESPSGYQVSTAAAVGATAALQTTIQINTAIFDGILWELDSFRLGWTNPNVETRLSIEGAGGVGVSYRQGATDYRGKLRGSDASDVFVNYNLRKNEEGPLRRNIGLLLLPRHEEVFFLEHGNVVGYRDVTGNYLDGLVAPSVSIIAQEAAGHYLRLSAVRLTVWHN